MRSPLQAQLRPKMLIDIDGAIYYFVAHPPRELRGGENRRKQESNLTNEEAKKLLDRESQQRTTACQKAVQAAIDEHRCVLVVAIIATERGSRAQLTIVPRD